jgi:hypothetical protein
VSQRDSEESDTKNKKKAESRSSGGDSRLGFGRGGRKGGAEGKGKEKA